MHRRSPSSARPEDGKTAKPAYARDDSGEKAGSTSAGDLLGIYFDEISEIPLLTREEEIEIAKEMERAALDVRTAAMRTPLAARYIAELADRVSIGRIPVASLFATVAETDDAGQEEQRVSRFRAHVRRVVTLLSEYSELDAAKRPTTRCAKDRERLQVRIGREAAKCDLPAEHVDRICGKLEEAYDCAYRAAARKTAAAAKLIADARQFTGLTLPELRDVVAQIDCGRRRAHAAKERLVVANLRLVVSIAKQYRAGSLTLSDLVQEGNFGLIRAAEGFDWRRGFKFSTYAKWWIRSFVFDCIENQAPVIRLPKHMRDTKARIKHAENSLRDRLKRTPSVDEIAEHAGLTPAKVKMAIASENESYSLDAPLGNNPDDSPFVDGIADPRPAELEDVSEMSGLEPGIDGCIEMLGRRESEILAMRHGLDGLEPAKLREVGKRFGVSRERIRQIESGALRRLRTETAGSSVKTSRGTGKKRRDS